MWRLLAWLNPVVIPGLLAGTCAVLLGSLLIVCKCVCHLSNKELLYFTLRYVTEYRQLSSQSGHTSKFLTRLNDIRLWQQRVQVLLKHTTQKSRLAGQHHHVLNMDIFGYGRGTSL